MQGFGVTARSAAEARRLEPTGITTFRQADVGEYLREVRCEPFLGAFPSRGKYTEPFYNLLTIYDIIRKILCLPLRKIYGRKHILSVYATLWLHSSLSIIQLSSSVPPPPSYPIQSSGAPQPPAGRGGVS